MPVCQIMEYIRHYSSERAKPFRWTYTGKPLAAGILFIRERDTTARRQ